MHLKAKALILFLSDSMVIYPMIITKLLPSVKNCLLNKRPAGEFTIVASRSHMSPKTEAYITTEKKKHPVVNIVSAGSSLKFCLVAEGKADAYPRFGPTMEWDTGAGHIIVTETGKKLVRYRYNGDLTYNKPNLLNPDFLVY